MRDYSVSRIGIVDIIRAIERGKLATERNDVADDARRRGYATGVLDLRSIGGDGNYDHPMAIIWRDRLGQRCPIVHQVSE
jgi:hypothetical protein